MLLHSSQEPSFFGTSDQPMHIYQAYIWQKILGVPGPEILEKPYISLRGSFLFYWLPTFLLKLTMNWFQWHVRGSEWLSGYLCGVSWLPCTLFLLMRQGCPALPMRAGFMTQFKDIHMRYRYMHCIKMVLKMLSWKCDINPAHLDEHRCHSHLYAHYSLSIGLHHSKMNHPMWYRTHVPSIPFVPAVAGGRHQYSIWGHLFHHQTLAQSKRETSRKGEKRKTGKLWQWEKAGMKKNVQEWNSELRRFGWWKKEAWSGIETRQPWYLAIPDSDIKAPKKNYGHLNFFVFFWFFLQIKHCTVFALRTSSLAEIYLSVLE